MIDAHHHFWRRSRGDYGWLTPDLGPLYRDFGPGDLAPLLAGAGVTGTVLVQAAPTEAETGFLLDLAETCAFVLGVVGWTDLTAPDAPGRIRELAAAPRLCGLRPMIQDEPDPGWILRPEVGQGLAALSECGLAFDALVRPHHLAALSQVADAHPGLRIILDHAGKPDIAGGGFAPWATGIAELARRPNVACKVSGLLTEAGERTGDADLAPYVDHLLETFGPDRLLWGSDWPVLGLAGDYPGWSAQARRLLDGLSSADRESVFRANAIRAYRLSPRA